MQVQTYHGSGKSRNEYQALAVTKIPQHIRENEAELRTSRWFDYRFMTPAEATYLFAAEYRHAYIEAFKRTRDIRTADKVRPFSPDDIFESKELTAMWQARQAADMIGCRYEFFLRFAFLRFEHRGWRFFPRANQLSPEELVLDIRDAWATECRASLQVAQLPIYRAEAYAGVPEQDEYHEWLCGQVKHREHPHLALSRLVYSDPILPEQVAEKHFSAEILKRAKIFAQ
jgi:hypothetical protein